MRDYVILTPGGHQHQTDSRRLTGVPLIIIIHLLLQNTQLEESVLEDTTVSIITITESYILYQNFPSNIESRPEIYTGPSISINWVR
mgnify:CR=1 FL=1